VSGLIITSRQIRAARGLIGWTQADLAAAANLSRSTVAAIEKETANPTFDVLNRIRAEFENRQVEFLTQEGVRFRQPTIQYDDQPDANRRLLEDIYKVASEFKFKTNTGDILIFGLKEEDSKNSLEDFLSQHIKRLELAGLEEKILCSPDTQTFVAPKPWYRILSELDPAQSPIHIYGDKIAVLQWRPKETVILVESKPIATAFRAMFYQIWNTRTGVGHDT
jgi:transcriptional regulator with XRE-family HTH domain